MYKFHKFFLALGALAILFSAFAAVAPASAAPVAKEVYMRYADISKARVISTAPGSVTIRVTGDYTCDKPRYNGYVSGKTIYIEVWDVKRKGSECNNSEHFTRDLTFSRLVPGKYTVLVNVNYETGVHERKIKDVIVPVYPEKTPAPAK